MIPWTGATSRRSLVRWRCRRSFTFFKWRLQVPSGACSRRFFEVYGIVIIKRVGPGGLLAAIHFTAADDVEAILPAFFGF